MHSKGSSPRNNVSTSDYLPFYKVIKHEVFKLYLLSKSARDTINHSKNRMKFQSVAVVHDFLVKFPCDRSVPSVQCSSRTFLQHRFFSFFLLSIAQYHVYCAHVCAFLFRFSWLRCVHVSIVCSHLLAACCLINNARTCTSECNSSENAPHSIAQRSARTHILAEKVNAATPFLFQCEEMRRRKNK